MKLLYICHRYPFPPNRGGKIRPFQMIQHLSQEHSVTVASLAHTAQELRDGEGLKKHCAEALGEVLPSSVRWIQAGLRLPSLTPSSVAYFRSSRLARRINDIWREGKFDGLMVHCAFVAQYALELKDGFRILDFGDIDSAKWLDYSRFRRFPLSVGYGLEARKLRRYETRAAQQFDHITVTTQGESEEFKTFGVEKPCTVIPNGVDSNYFSIQSATKSASPVIVFLGRMDYFPNIEGICRFTREIFPQIRAAMPAALLRIVGSDPVASVRHLTATPGVEVTGFVPDVRPYMQDAAVAIAPLHIARGTQNKILQCMAMGIPVVSSPEAAKGIQAVSGEHILVADGPEAFADSVINVLQDEGLRSRISAAGRLQVQRAHQWANSMKILDGVLAKCIGTASINPR